MMKKTLSLTFFTSLSLLLLSSLALGCLGTEKEFLPITTESEKALAYYNKAIVATYQAYEKEGLENFKLAIEADPAFVMARTWYARFLSSPNNQKQIDEAKKYFDEVSKGERDYTLAIEAQLNNNIEKEIELLEKLVSEYPDDGMVHAELAAAYSLNKMYENAVQEYKKAIFCNPDNYGAYNSLGYGYIRIGKFEEAIKWLKKYSKLMPASANPLDSLGDAYRNAGKYKEAWGCYKKALKIKPDFTASLLHLGDVKHELGYYEEALHYYREALDTLLQEREISESHYNLIDSLYRPRLANTHLYLHNISEAKKEIGTILAHNTHFGNTLGHYLSGELALLKGNTKKAREEANLVQKYVKEHNLYDQEKDQIVNFQRAKISIAEGDLAQAEKNVLEAINAFGTEGQSNLLSRVYSLGSERQICVKPLNLLAEIKRESNKQDEEILAIKKSLLLIPHQPRLHYRLGEIYEQRNQIDKAARKYKHFLCFVKDFNWDKEDIEKAQRFISKSVRAQDNGENLSRFLEETSHLDFNHPIFQETLAKVATDNMTTEKKLKRLYYFTRDLITFVPSASLTASRALEEMKAICYTKAMIYVSFCRLLGVPANLAMVEFIIKARPKEIVSGHGIAKIFYNGRWIYLDTVSNKEAWSWWDKKNAQLFEAPGFSLERNVLVDERFISNLALKDFETNDVPEEWLKSLQNFLEKGKW